MKKEVLWTKDFLLLTVTNFLVFTSFFIYMSTISTYTVQSLGGTTTIGGIAVSIFIVGVLLARIFIGAWIEQIGRKQVLLGGLLFYAGLSFLFFFIHHLLPLLLLRFFHGIFCGMTLTAANTITPSLVPKKRRGEGIGYYGMSISLAIAVGPFLGMKLIHAEQFTAMFILCSGFSVTAFLTACLIQIPVFSLNQTQRAELKQWKWKNFIEKKCLPLASIGLLVGFAYSSVMSFISFYGQTLRLETYTTYFFLINAICILLTRPYLGKLYDRKGVHFVLYPALILLSIGMVLYSQTTHGLGLLIAGALMGIGYGAYQLGGQTLASSLIPPYRMGVSVSTFFIFLDAGMGIGPTFHGWLSKQIGFDSMYTINAALFIIALIIYTFFTKKGYISKTEHYEKTETTGF
ncbi:MAG TPA: MFS transporter [Firmicutes bacterium]|nr:MFS transporter [Bacillota bacterium]